MKKQRLLFNPEKSFDLRVYVEQMALAFAEFGCSKSRPHKPKYALNVLDFIDGSTSKDREMSDSSTNDNSATKSTAT